MNELQSFIERSTIEMISEREWQSVIIDMEVEERGREPRKYFVDSSVAVCICKIDKEWTDDDLELSKEYRELFHSLYAASDPKWGSCRLMLEKDGSAKWNFELPPAKRLNGESDPKLDEIIERLVSVSRSAS